MAETSTTLHEHRELLTTESLEAHRGIVSLIEELEAIDWYNQRMDATQDSDLHAILAHNKDEESEHAMMLLEWLRRREPALDREMRTYLFTRCDIISLSQHGDFRWRHAVAGRRWLTRTGRP